ncbi:hypothetical protein AAG570_000357 [Ranatra chinensis]|uniref:Uncharacterized protein n=1 Tax=Ranatra chinensis TaxID=642074 RepID=A0ABD0YX53_9HEMI
MRELRKQKRSSKREKHRHESTDMTASMHEFFAKHKHSSSMNVAGRGRSRVPGAPSKTSNFLASLNPARWGRTNDRNYHKVGYRKVYFNIFFSSGLNFLLWF